MPLQLIGAGFGRTGTQSLHEALNQLGFPCYHMVEVLDNPRNKGHLDFWLDVSRSQPGVQHDWERVFADYTATVDNPGSCVWRELLVKYPGAKVILTTHPRGADTWYESTWNTIYAFEWMWQFGVVRAVIPFFRKMGAMVHALIWERQHRGTMKDRARAIAFYHQYVEDVKASVPPEKLLVYSVDQGWGPLCAFVGKPVPSTPFPNVNDRVEFQKRLAKVRMVAYAILAIGAAVVVGVAAALSGS